MHRQKISLHLIRWMNAWSLVDSCQRSRSNFQASINPTRSWCGIWQKIIAYYSFCAKTAKSQLVTLCYKISITRFITQWPFFLISNWFISVFKRPSFLLICWVNRQIKNLSNGVCLVNIFIHKLLITLARLCNLKKYVVNLIKI